MQKITVTIEAVPNGDKLEIRIVGDPDPETLGFFEKNIRALLMLVASQAISSVFRKIGYEKVGGETKTEDKE